MTPLAGNTIWHWPEFMAFWARLDLPKPANGRLTILMAFDEVVSVTYDKTTLDSNHVTQQVWIWPEFEALRKRLGIVLDGTRTLTIQTGMDELSRIWHEYYAQDKGAL